MAGKQHIGGRLSADTLARYSQLKAHLGLAKTPGADDQCLRTLLDAYETSADKVEPSTLLDDLGYGTAALAACTPAERHKREQQYADILAAMALPHVDLATLVRNGLVREARIQNTQARKQPMDPDAPMPTVIGKDGIERSTNRTRGSAYLRVHRFVEDLMQHNLVAKHAMDVIYITQGTVADATRSHSNIVKAYFEEYADTLAEHHQSLGFTSPQDGIRHNRLRAAHMRQQSINQSEREKAQ